MVVSVVAAVSAFAVGVYSYERHRGPTDSVFFGTWQMHGLCLDCTFYYRLQPDHNVIGFREADADFRSPVGHGRWYAGGELLVIHFATGDGGSMVDYLRVVDIAPDLIRLRSDGHDVLMQRAAPSAPQASNHAMQRTAGRSAFPLSMTSTFNLQPRAPSPAVADLVSR